MPTKIVQLGNLSETRELLQYWEDVRREILRGRLKSFYTVLRDDMEREMIFLGGVYRKDSAEAAKASMRLSWQMTKRADAEEGELWQAPPRRSLDSQFSSL